MYNILVKTVLSDVFIDLPFLTIHTARHTFGTIMLTKGVSIESVSKMLRHTNITTTQIYAKILNEKIYVEVNKVRGEFDAFQEYYKQAN